MFCRFTFLIRAEHIACTVLISDGQLKCSDQAFSIFPVWIRIRRHEWREVDTVSVFHIPDIPAASDFKHDSICPISKHIFYIEPHILHLLVIVSPRRIKEVIANTAAVDPCIELPETAYAEPCTDRVFPQFKHLSDIEWLVTSARDPFVCQAHRVPLVCTFPLKDSATGSGA